MTIRAACTLTVPPVACDCTKPSMRRSRALLKLSARLTPVRPSSTSATRLAPETHRPRPCWLSPEPPTKFRLPVASRLASLATVGGVVLPLAPTPSRMLSEALMFRLALLWLTT